MKQIEKRLAALLALLLAAAMLAGCGGKDGGFSPIRAENAANLPAGDSEEWILTNKSANSVALGTPDNPLDPEQIYRTLEYIPEMFYGRYTLVGGDEAIKQYVQDVGYISFNAERHYRYDKAEAEEREITAIPYAVAAGQGNLYGLDPETRIPEYHWMKAYFQMKVGEERYAPVELYFAYEVDGDTLGMRMLKNVELDPDTLDVISYEFGDLTLRYQYAFRGLNLTLSQGDKSVTMQGARYGIGGEDLWMSVAGKVMPEEKHLDEISSIGLNYNPRDGYTSVSIMFEDENIDYDVSQRSIVSMKQNGLITFTIPYEEGEKTYQFVYFFLANDGILLTDGKENYFYHSWHGDYYTQKLSDVLGDDVDPKTLSDEDAEELIETQTDVIDDLNDSFEETGVEADLNPETGRVTLDSSVLFASDSAELSDEGKAYLDTFVQAYADAVLNKGHAQQIRQIIIEGHTDSDGSYAYNQELSERRAQAVADYCLQLRPELESYLVVRGCSSDDPVLRADGTEDKDASRRVVFKFILNVEG